MGGRKQKFVDNSLSIAHRLIIISSSQSVLNKTLWFISVIAVHLCDTSRTKFQDQTAVTLCPPCICQNNFINFAFQDDRMQQTVPLFGGKIWTIVPLLI